MITLLTDFGWQDAYVGVMKGIIISHCPTTPVIDLTHGIPPQDVVAARFQLLCAFPYFPPRTIHVVVVDPGVGTQRRAIAVQIPEGYLVGPDNGVLSGVYDRSRILNVVHLTNPTYWRTPTPSATFQGRDIFAPVAAHLANGLPFSLLGEHIAPDSLVRLDLPMPLPTPQGILGCLQYVDHFGNGVTNLLAEQVGDRPWQLTLGPLVLPGTLTYGGVAPGAPLALIGSHGYLEIAINQGSAQRQLGLSVGDPVLLTLAP